MILDTKTLSKNKIFHLYVKFHDFWRPFENIQIRPLRRHFSACQHWFSDSAYQITPNHGVKPFSSQNAYTCYFLLIFFLTNTTNTRHQEDEQSKVTSSVFPIEMIANLECIQSNTQQNIEQLQNPTMGVTIKNESTTNEPPP